jgi:chloramphenicol O-acetyltransferase
MIYERCPRTRSFSSLRIHVSETFEEFHQLIIGEIRRLRQKTLQQLFGFTHTKI